MRVKSDFRDGANPERSGIGKSRRRRMEESECQRRENIDVDFQIGTAHFSRLCIFLLTCHLSPDYRTTEDDEIDVDGNPFYMHNTSVGKVLE